VRVAGVHGARAYRIDGPDAIDPAWLADAEVVGVTAGASAPDQLVFAVIEAIGPAEGVEMVQVTTEGEYFPLPRDLRRLLAALQAAVEGGYSAREPGRSGELDHDREWTANEALALLALSPQQPPG
jgi:4-hydroxy-3-methylbut-2-enyl diphosphate reductase